MPTYASPLFLYLKHLTDGGEEVERGSILPPASFSCGSIFHPIAPWLALRVNSPGGEKKPSWSVISPSGSSFGLNPPHTHVFYFTGPKLRREIGRMVHGRKRTNKQTLISLFFPSGSGPIYRGRGDRGGNERRGGIAQEEEADIVCSSSSSSSSVRGSSSNQCSEDRREGLGKEEEEERDSFPSSSSPPPTIAKKSGGRGSPHSSSFPSLCMSLAPTPYFFFPVGGNGRRGRFQNIFTSAAVVVVWLQHCRLRHPSGGGGGKQERPNAFLAKNKLILGRSGVFPLLSSSTSATCGSQL